MLCICLLAVVIYLVVGIDSVSVTERPTDRPHPPFTLILTHQANEEEEGGQQEEGGGGAVVARGNRLDIAELLGNAFIFLLAGTHLHVDTV